MEHKVPGDTRVQIEYLLTYIRDIGTITSYLQIPREWVEQTQRESTAKRYRIRGDGDVRGGGAPTLVDKAIPRSHSLGCEALRARCVDAFQSLSIRSGVPIDTVVILTLGSRDAKLAIAPTQNCVDGARRKEARP